MCEKLVKYKCSKCQKILDSKTDCIRPWFERGKGGLCHPVTYFSEFLGENDTYLCGPLLKLN